MASGRTLQYPSKGISTAGGSRGPVSPNAPFCKGRRGLWGAPTSREHGESLSEQERGLFPRTVELLLREVCLLTQQEIRQGHREGKIWELGQVPVSLQAGQKQCGCQVVKTKDGEFT